MSNRIIVPYAKNVPVNRYLKEITNNGLNLRGLGANLGSEKITEILKQNEAAVILRKEGMEFVGKDAKANEILSKSIQNIENIDVIA